MKIEIDFDNKTILIKSDCKISDLMTKLKSLKINLSEYTIIGTSVVNTVTWPVTYPANPQPWTTPWYDGTGTTPYTPPYKVTCNS